MRCRSTPRSSTSAASTTTSASSSSAPSRRRAPAGTSARTSSAAVSTATSSSTAARARTSAVRRRRSSSRWRGCAASRVSSRRSPRSKVSTGKPTVVNNVETLCNMPHIVQRGGEWFKSLGTEKSAGTRVFCASGHINRPGNYEMRLGHPDSRAARRGMRRHLEGPLHQGVPARWRLDAGAPAAAPRPAPRHGCRAGGRVLTRSGRDGLHGRDHVSRRRLDAACRLLPPRVRAENACPAAREPTSNRSSCTGSRRGLATNAELASLADICSNMDGRCFCPLGDTATWFVMSAYKAFRDEFEAHCGAGRCPVSGAGHGACPWRDRGGWQTRNAAPEAPDDGRVGVSIDGRALRVPKRNARARRRHRGRHPHPDLLRPSQDGPGRGLPDVPGQHREGPEATTRMRHHRR